MALLLICASALLAIPLLYNSYRFVRRWLWTRKLRGSGLVLGIDIFTGGAEEIPQCRETTAALTATLDRLRKVGITIGQLHPAAGCSLRNEGIWFDRITETKEGTAHVVVAGDWRQWEYMDSRKERFFSLTFTMYHANGSEVKLGKHDGSMELRVWLLPTWLTQQRLIDKAMHELLRGLAISLNDPVSNPGYTYDTSRWPYTEAVA